MKKIVKVLLIALVLASCGKKLPTAELNQKLDNKESFVLYINQTTCSACAEFNPVLKEVKKNYQVEYYDWVVDTDKSEKADIEALVKRLNLPESLATPTLVIIKEGTTRSFQVGFMPYRDLLDYFKTYGIIQ